MIEMSNREYSEFTRDLFAKFNAGENDSRGSMCRTGQGR